MIPGVNRPWMDGRVIPMKTPELRKQISIFLPLSAWRAIRVEAARQRIPMTELCRRWMKPELTRLCRSHQEQFRDDD